MKCSCSLVLNAATSAKTMIPNVMFSSNSICVTKAPVNRDFSISRISGRLFAIFLFLPDNFSSACCFSRGISISIFKFDYVTDCLCGLRSFDPASLIRYTLPLVVSNSPCGEPCEPYRFRHPVLHCGRRSRPSYQTVAHRYRQSGR